MGCIWSAEYHEVREPPVINACDITKFRTGSVVYLGESLQHISALGVLVQLDILSPEKKTFLLEYSPQPGYDWISGIEVPSGVRLSALTDAIKRTNCNRMYCEQLESPHAVYADSAVFRMCQGTQRNPSAQGVDRLVVEFNSSLRHYNHPNKDVPRFSHQNLVRGPAMLAPICAYRPDADGNFSNPW